MLVKCYRLESAANLTDFVSKSVHVLHVIVLKFKFSHFVGIANFLQKYNVLKFSKIQYPLFFKGLKQSATNMTGIYKNLKIHSSPNCNILRRSVFEIFHFEIRDLPAVLPVKILFFMS